MENSIWTVKVRGWINNADMTDTYFFGGDFSDLCEKLPEMFNDDEIIELTLTPYENFTSITDFDFSKEQVNG